jgi:hypothetical protein
MLVLTDGTFFPPGCCAIPWGCAGGPAGLAPEATPSRFYSQRCLCAQRLSQLASAVFQPASAAPYAYVDIGMRLVHIQEVYPRVEPPSLGPFEAIGTGSPTFPYVPSPSLRGMGARCLRLPSSGSRIAGSSSSYYRVVQVDAHAPFDKGRLMVRRLIHESALRGCDR